MDNVELYDTLVTPPPRSAIASRYQMDDLRLTARELLPKRFQRVRGWTMPANGKCCSRPGRWGNPFVGEWAATAFARFGFHSLFVRSSLDVRISDALEHAIVKRLDLTLHLPMRWPIRTTAAEFFAGVAELAGRPLGCFCALNEPCHVDTLLVLANELSLRRAGHDPAQLLRLMMGGPAR